MHDVRLRIGHRSNPRKDWHGQIVTRKDSNAVAFKFLNDYNLAEIPFIHIKANVSIEYPSPVRLDSRGPGGSGVDLIRFLATVVGTRFDIVGQRDLNFSSDTVASSSARIAITGQLAGERAIEAFPHTQTDHTARDILTITNAHWHEKEKRSRIMVSLTLIHWANLPDVVP
ncbi:hypothetical protein MPER_05185 [Moniliophthora perniciosa FA553]|nr:hypothetical protein MPER_05185 [Moniliophthora perniciosa FA553]